MQHTWASTYIVSGTDLHESQIVFVSHLSCSPMKAKDALFYGIMLVVLGASLYVLSGVFVTVYTVSSDSYWTYYEFQHNTHYEYQCWTLGVTPTCALFYYFARGGAGALSFSGAVMMAVSLYRLIEGPRTLFPTPSTLGLCPKCGTINPLSGKYCSECATKLA
jgi:hypothetical protein